MRDEDEAIDVGGSDLDSSGEMAIRLVGRVQIYLKINDSPGCIVITV